MKTQILLTILLGLTALTRTHAQNTLDGSPTLVFATVEEAAEILTAHDDFVRRMSPFDRAARMKTERGVTEDEYLSFVGKSVLSWNSAEQQRIAAAYQEIEAELKKSSLQPGRDKYGRPWIAMFTHPCQPAALALPLGVH